ncbi:MAG: hypothetical protein RIS94_2150 [Pseudomonadota bacterium]|jgi:lipopolysaccharide/colanic/teichoic acid biosynthesis glycosyltransferase
MSEAMPIRAAYWDHTPVRPARALPRPWLGEGVIRAIDVIVAMLALVMAFPVLLVIALLIRCSGHGPVVFAHRRVGRGGRSFHCLKFRTMAVDADARLKAVLESCPAAREEWARTQKLRHDPRVTWYGLFLRRSSLDELPQLVNVLRGEMSLVGPRPIVESEIPRYGRHFAVYCSVKPGLTGLWQVQRSHDTSYRRRVAFDVAYARSRSVRLNLRIMMLTVPTVMLGRGAC